MATSSWGTPEQCAAQLVELVEDWGVDVVKIASRLLGSATPPESPRRVLQGVDAGRG